MADESSSLPMVFALILGILGLGVLADGLILWRCMVHQKTLPFFKNQTKWLEDTNLSLLLAFLVITFFGPVIGVVYGITYGVLLVFYKGVFKNILRPIFYRFRPQRNVQNTDHEQRPRVGYRMWRITTYGMRSRPLLAPMSNLCFHSCWKPGENIADCYSITIYHDKKWWKIRRETPPVENCKCGIYSKHSIDELESEVLCKQSFPYHYEESGLGRLKIRTAILGSIVAYGNVIPGDHGMRAEKARIAALYVPRQVKEIPEPIQQVSEIYGAPIVRSYNELTEKAELMADEMAGKIDRAFEELVQASLSDLDQRDFDEEPQ